MVREAGSTRWVQGARMDKMRSGHGRPKVMPGMSNGPSWTYLGMSGRAVLGSPVCLYRHTWAYLCIYIGIEL